MTPNDTEHIADGSPTAEFNEVMRKVEQHLKLVDVVEPLNPAYVAKLRVALDGARKSREEANAQQQAIMDALVECFPQDVERAAIANWFIFVAMGQGYAQAFKFLSDYALMGGEPLAVPQYAPPAPQLPSAFMPGIRIGPWKSRGRAKALRAVASLGNPHGAGRVFKAALETYVQTSRMISGVPQEQLEHLRIIGAILSSKALELVIEGADEAALLELDAKADDPESHDVSVTIRLSKPWMDDIETRLRSKQVKSGSLKYWTPTMARVGVSEDFL